MSLGSELLGAQPGSINTGGDATPPANYTIGTGLTLTGTTVTSDLSTGKAGGQSATGGTAASEALTLTSTASATKGKINLGAAALSWFDEAATGAAQAGAGSVLTLGLPAGANFVNVNFNVNGTKKAAISGTSGGFLSFAAGSGGHVFYLGDFGQYHVFFNSNGNALFGPGATEDNTANLLKLVINKSVASAAGAAWDGFRMAAPQCTLTGSTNVTELAAGRMEQPTITAASVLTVTDAATLTIDGPPIAGGSLAFGTADNASGAKALWIKSGIARFDGGIKLKTNLGLEAVAGTLTLTGGNGDVNLVATGAGNTVKIGGQGIVANGVVATAMSSLGPAGSHTTIQEWLTIKNSAGTLRYIPLF